MNHASNIVPIRRAHLHEVQRLGFRHAGAYSQGEFAIKPHWRERRVIYLWARGGELEEILRVGIACGDRGFGSRYDHYNRWLDGRFKKDDEREQKVRSLFLARLGSKCDVWAREVNDKAQALREETQLRRDWGDILDLDLMVKSSWGSLEMRAWRANHPPQPPKTSRQHISISRLTETRQTMSAAPSPSIKALLAQMDALLKRLGLSPSPVKTGTSYKLGAATLCRIDPKAEFLRVEVGAEAEAAAPAQLRGSYRQKGWLIVRPQDALHGLNYVEKCIGNRMRKRLDT